MFGGGSISSGGIGPQQALQIASSQDPNVFGIFEDFLGSPNGRMNWTDMSVNGAKTVCITNDYLHPGVIDNQTGVATNGSCVRALSGGVTTGDFTSGLCTGNGVMTFEYSVKVPTLSGSGDNFYVDIGLASSSTWNTHAIGFVYVPDILGPNWWTLAMSSAQQSFTNSAVPVSTNWVKLKATVSTNKSVDFFIDGVKKVTTTTNIPAASISPCFKITKSIGTNSRSLYVDYFRLIINMTITR